MFDKEIFIRKGINRIILEPLSSRINVTKSRFGHKIHET